MELLIGLRRYGSSLAAQTWPTPDDLRAHSGIAASVPDADLQSRLDSAVAVVTRICTETSGGVSLA
jgi:hypothetical protein